MRRLALLVALALAPAAVFAAAPGGAPGGPAGDDRWEQAQRRSRLARTLGLAEALGLDEAGALRVRDVLQQHDEKAAPLRNALRDGLRTLHAAARGDQAAGAQVDAALAKLRDTRNQLLALAADTFNELTKGLTPEKKARAALFLARYERRFMQHDRAGWGPRSGRTMEGGPGMNGPGMMERRGMGLGSRGAPGSGPGRGPGPGPCSGSATGDGPDDDGEGM